MKELQKKYKEIETRRNAIAVKNSGARETVRALKADYDRHEQAIKELHQAKQKTLYADLGQVEKKIEVHEKAREELMDKIGDSEYVFSVCKRQLITLDSELNNIKSLLFHAVADDLVKSISADTKTHLLQIYTAIKLGGRRPETQGIFDMIFTKGWDFGGMPEIEAGIMKKFNLT